MKTCENLDKTESGTQADVSR